MRKSKKKIFGIRQSSSGKNNLLEELKKASDGLYYMSEIDAELTPFVGNKAQSVSKEEILRQTNNSLDTPVEERSFAEVFYKLTKIQDWYGEEEIAAAEKFAALKNLLESNLKDLKVYNIGKIELDIYFVGLDAEKVLMGIKTKAVRT